MWTEHSTLSPSASNPDQSTTHRYQILNSSWVCQEGKIHLWCVGGGRGKQSGLLEPSNDVARDGCAGGWRAWKETMSGRDATREAMDGGGWPPRFPRALLCPWRWLLNQYTESAAPSDMPLKLASSSLPVGSHCAAAVASATGWMAPLSHSCRCRLASPRLSPWPRRFQQVPLYCPSLSTTQPNPTIPYSRATDGHRSLCPCHSMNSPVKDPWFLVPFV